MTEKQLKKLRTFADVCKAEGKDEKDYKTSKRKKAWLNSAICLRRLKLICKPFNGKRKPNMADTTQEKLYAWAWIKEKDADDKRPFGFRLAYCGCDCARSISSLSARPYLLDRKWVQHVFENFKSEFEEWMYWENLTFQEED